MFLISFGLFCEDIGQIDILKSVVSYHPLLQASEQEIIKAESELLANNGAFDRYIRFDSASYPSSDYERNRFDTTVEQPLLFNGSKVFAGYRHSDGTLPSYEDEFKTSSGGKFRAGFEVPLLRDRATDKRRNLINKSEIEKNIAEKSFELRKNDLLRAASIAFANWRAASKRLEVYNQLLTFSKKRINQMTAKHSAGDIAKFDVDDNQRQILQRESQVASAKQYLQSAIQDLSLFHRNEKGDPILNLNVKPEKSSIVIPAELMKINVEDLVKNHPDFEITQYKIKKTTLDKSLAENQYLPKLDAQVVAEQDAGKDSNNNDETEVKIGIKIEIPLQQRTAEGRKLIAQAESKQLENKNQFALEKIRTDLENVKNNVITAKERIRLAKKEADLAYNLEVGEQQRFDNGDSNLIFLNLREQTAAESAIRVIDAELDLEKYLADLRFLSLYWNDYKLD